MHEGIDIGVGYGTPIEAAAGGHGRLRGLGVRVRELRRASTTANGLATAYGHQSRIAVSNGEAVSQGQVIGYVGCTGHCFGPHLHFEVRVNGYRGRSARLPVGHRPVPGACHSAEADVSQSPRTVWLAAAGSVLRAVNVDGRRLTAATTDGATVVVRRLTSTPMTSRSLVKRTSGISANGIPKESTPG